MDLSFYISFSGIVTFKNAKEIQEVARKVPADRYLIETDSPYLAPAPFRGKSNYPIYVQHVAQYIADLRETDYATTVQQSNKNFRRLFTV
ncbi:hydrolase, TatD family [methanotrophic bacterial endosymbiont of Bathymodiolus sp.]|nr:hydrolase, TatD family [methanotrophic bacterial endosymbiont of Bathymodiolus sp.]